MCINAFDVLQMLTDLSLMPSSQSLARLSRNKSYDSQQLDKGTTPPENTQSMSGYNVLLLRAELSDFWKCCLSSPRWQRHVHIVQQYLLYPNPYPKKSRLKNRFYAHPAFPLLMMALAMNGYDGSDEAKLQLPLRYQVGYEQLFVRSNWKGYLEEFKSAVNVWEESGGNFEDFTKTIWDGENDEWNPRESPIKWGTIGPFRIDGKPMPYIPARPLTNFEAKYLECGEPVYELSVYRTSAERRQKIAQAHDRLRKRAKMEGNG